MAMYGKVDYWDERYSQIDDSYDWLQSKLQSHGQIFDVMGIFFVDTNLILFCFRRL